MRKLLAGFLTGAIVLQSLTIPVCAAGTDLSFFTGKVETVDLMDQIIADFNAQSDGITVEQEYQKDASNIIKIKFASGEAPDVMTTYEQEYVDQGKYLDLSDMDDIWDRLIPSMKESCTDVNSGKQYRICTNMTMAGFFYNKEIFEELDLTPAETWDAFVTNLETIHDQMPDVTPWFIFGSEAWHLGHLIEFIPHGYIKAKYGAIETKKAMLNNDKSVLNFGAPDGAMAAFAAGLLELQEKGLLNADVLTATSDNCVDAFVHDGRRHFYGIGGGGLRLQHQCGFRASDGGQSLPGISVSRRKPEKICGKPRLPVCVH